MRTRPSASAAHAWSARRASGSPRPAPSPRSGIVFVVLSGLAARFPKSRLFGAFDRTWASPDRKAEVDWVPGAFSIMRREALAQTGLFDPRFFLYCEEVDLCRRIKAAGFRVLYWPDVVVTHIGGESGRQLTTLKFSDSEAQVVLWRMRATLLYFRKHHGFLARGASAGLRMPCTRCACAQSQQQRPRPPPARRRSKSFYVVDAPGLAGNQKAAAVSPPQPW
jgi:hypothetical protein